MPTGTDETTTQETGLNESQTDSKQPPVDDAGAEEFDTAAFEEQFGFSAGHLKDCKTVDDVLSAVATFTDKTLIAGLDAGETDEADPATFPAKQEPAKADPPAKPDAAKGGNESAEFAALRDRIGQLESKLQENELQHARTQQAELERRLNSEIDSWASAKYGVGANRNFKQAQAAKEVKKLVNTHVAGLLSTGQPIPTIEILARRVRAFDDDTFKPAARKADAAAALGTPGTNKDAKGGADQPANIHMALARNPN